MYFNTIKTIEEAKNLFRDLCKKLHPDTSGYDSNNDFVRMFTEFKKFKPTEKVEQEENFDASKFYNLLKSFDALENVKLNFVGSFIWLEDIVYNATYTQKDKIKAIVLEGYNTARYAPTKKLWYFSPVDYVQKSKGKKNLEEIKKKYGAHSFNLNETLKIN
jgi:hypothetical protein